MNLVIGYITDKGKPRELSRYVQETVKKEKICFEKVQLETDRRLVADLNFNINEIAYPNKLFFHPLKNTILYLLLHVTSPEKTEAPILK